jgi:hypothetical protein
MMLKEILEVGFKLKSQNIKMVSSRLDFENPYITMGEVSMGGADTSPTSLIVHL